MAQLERRAAMAPLLADGYSRSEAYQLMLAAESRALLASDDAGTPLERTRKRNAEARTSVPAKRTPTVKPTAPKPAAKRTVAAAPLDADRKPSSLLAAMIRTARTRRTPRPAR